MSAGNFRRLARGVSLVEALVAMIVMSFGTLAVLGVQATLRANGDISKQRAEAVRIAQQALERWRAYEGLQGVAEGAVYFGALAEEETSVEGTNASYTVALGVPEEADDPLRKTIVVDVSWTDRAGESHTVRLRSALGGVPPELAGTLGLPSGRSVLRNPQGRHPAIPSNAAPIDGGRSRFTPPGAPAGVSWVFDNNTGFIVQLCDAEGCSPFAGRLLAGVIRFSTDGPPNAEVPGSPRLAQLQVRVTQTFPLSLLDNVVQCAEDLGPTGYMPYYCAMPIGDQASWSGRVSFSIPDPADPSSNLVVGTIGNGSADGYKICRYTPYWGSHRTAPTQMTNAEHPLDYERVEFSLTNQNYLVIRAGDGAGTSYGCPDDDLDTPQVPGTTWHQQPAS